MKIKTVCRTFTEEGLCDFDREVNELLAAGWRLANRGYVPGCDFGTSFFRPCCYAELVKLDEADMEEPEAEPVTWQEMVDVLRVTWQEAVEVIKETCRDAVACDKSCPAYEWCQKNIPDSAPPPETWSDPE